MIMYNGDTKGYFELFGFNFLKLYVNTPFDGNYQSVNTYVVVHVSHPITLCMS